MEEEAKDAEATGLRTSLVKTTMVGDLDDHFDRRHPNTSAVRGSRRQRGEMFGKGIEAGPARINLLCRNGPGCFRVRAERITQLASTLLTLNLLSPSTAGTTAAGTTAAGTTATTAATAATTTPVFAAGIKLGYFSIAAHAVALAGAVAIVGCAGYFGYRYYKRQQADEIGEGGFGGPKGPGGPGGKGPGRGGRGGEQGGPGNGGPGQPGGQSPADAGDNS